MYDFEYYAPTKVFFGRDSDEKIGTVLRVMVLRGYCFITAGEVLRNQAY